MRTCLYIGLHLVALIWLGAAMVLAAAAILSSEAYRGGMRALCACIPGCQHIGEDNRPWSI